VSKTKQAYEKFRDLLKTELEIKHLGKLKYILGVRVDFVKNRIAEILRTFSFHKRNKVYTPMEPHSTSRIFLESEV
jgi:hypothetical protein